MQYFQRAQEELRQKNFVQAKQYFLDSLNNESIDNEQKIICAENIISIDSKLSLSTTPDFKVFLADLFVETQSFDKALSLYNEVLREKPAGKVLEKKFSAQESQGEIFETKKTVKDILDFYLLKKVTGRGRAFLLGLKDGYLNQEEKFYYLSWFYILEGNSKELTSLIQEASRENFNFVWEQLIHKSSFWFSDKELRKALISKFKDFDFSNLFFRKRDKKAFVKLAYDELIQNPTNQQTLDVLFKYSIVFEKKNLGMSFGEQLSEEDYAELVKLPAQKTMNSDSLDFGSDLMGEDNELGEIQKLERQIKFLETAGENEKIYDLQKKLAELDKDHPLLAVQSDKKAEEKRNDEKILEDLLKDIVKVSPTQGEGEHELLQNRLSALVKSLSQEKRREIYKDLVFSFNSMGFYSVSVSLLDEVLDFGLDLKQKIQVTYLKIETVMLQRAFHKALDIAREALLEFPLVDKEYLDFLYLEAEALYKIGQLQESLKIFKYIYSVDNSYRLSKVRIREIEKS